ncbi:hypothetical protein CDAR_465221, partial [Caerostris darwini]
MNSYVSSRLVLKVDDVLFHRAIERLKRIITKIAKDNRLRQHVPL